MDQLKVRMKDFPCAFNMEAPQPSRQRLQHMKNNVSTDRMVGKYSLMGIIRNKNILTWLEHLLDPEDNKAKDINKDVIKETKGKNIPSLGNRVFILWSESNKLDATTYLKELEGMRESPEFKDLITEAKAEQAYYYSRMGGFQNCDMSIKLFEEVVQLRPENHLWKFGLGLMHRRVTNCNVSYSVYKETNTAENIRLAKECLLDVTKSDDDEIQSLAYTQLMILFSTYSTSQHGECFQGFDIRSLCEKALEEGGENPTVLSHCGRVFMSYDIDRAIQLIENALSTRENTISYHNLGQCYERKADLTCNSSNVKPVDNTMESGLDLKSTAEQFQSPDIEHNIILKRHLANSKANLDESCEFVKQAVDMYSKAITISKNQNVPAMLSLGKLYTRLNRFKEAQQNFQKIIDLDDTKMSYLITLITAYEEAGKCMLELSKINQEEKQEFYEQGKEYLTKATSLAADLASMKTGLKQCGTIVWNSFEILKDDIDRMDECKYKGIEYIRLLQLIKDHKGIVSVIDDILKAKTKLDDPEMILSAINSYLAIGKYENALTFVNMVSLASGNVLKETENKASIRPEMEHHKVVITKVSLLVAWERLRKKSPDAKLMFQKSFAASYGDCTAFLSENQDEIGADILIVSDYSNDCEEGEGQSTEMAMRIQLVFSNFFGLTTFLDLEGSNKYGCLEADLRLEEMKKYPVVVIVLADGKRSSFFDIILSLLHQMKDKHGNPLNWFIIQSNENIKVPDTLAYDKQRRFTVSGDDPIIPKVVSLCSPFEPKAFETWKEQILNDDASIKLLMELFSFLLSFDFKNNCHVYLKSIDFSEKSSKQQKQIATL